MKESRERGQGREYVERFGYVFRENLGHIRDKDLERTEVRMD